MSANVTLICNMALSSIGVSVYVSNIETERSKAASVCKLLYDQARDLVLEQFDWDFARRNRKLALSQSTFSGWAFAYTYPTDCIRPHAIINPMARNQTADQRIPFKTITDDEGNRFILTDQEDAELTYTSRIEDTNLFSPSFIRALSLTLGELISMPMSVSPAIANRVAQLAKAAIENAVANNAESEQDEQAPESEFITARY